MHQATFEAKINKVSCKTEMAINKAGVYGTET